MTETIKWFFITGSLWFLASFLMWTLKIISQIRAKQKVPRWAYALAAMSFAFTGLVGARSVFGFGQNVSLTLGVGVNVVGAWFLYHTLKTNGEG